MFLFYGKNNTISETKTLYKLINIVNCCTDGSCLGRIVAWSDKASVIFKWIK